MCLHLPAVWQLLMQDCQLSHFWCETPSVRFCLTLPKQISLWIESFHLKLENVPIWPSRIMWLFFCCFSSCNKKHGSVTYIKDLKLHKSALEIISYFWFFIIQQHNGQLYLSSIKNCMKYDFMAEHLIPSLTSSGIMLSIRCNNVKHAATAL